MPNFYYICYVTKNDAQCFDMVTGEPDLMQRISELKSKGKLFNGVLHVLNTHNELDRNSFALVKNTGILCWTENDVNRWACFHIDEALNLKHHINELLKRGVCGDSICWFDHDERVEFKNVDLKF
jgi:hypothetical protein